MSNSIFWLQHAPLERRPTELVGSGSDRPLTSEGIERAHRMAQGIARIRRVGLLPDLGKAIVTSPLRRAVTTSEILASVLGLGVEIDERLRAQHFGILEGLTKAEIESTPGLGKHLHSNLPASELLADRAPGGESVQDALDRMTSSREDLQALDASPLVVTHGSILKTLVGSVNRRPIEEWGGIIREFKDSVLVDRDDRLSSINYFVEQAVGH